MKLDDVHAAQAALARRYLDRFGPATSEDLQWWTGWTKGDTARAVTAIGGPHVLDGPDEDVPEPAGVVSLLPGLDPTAMGWKLRDHHLDPDHVDRLFDRNGNVGPTVWLDGMVVGGWAVRPDGEVVTELLADVGQDAEDAVDREAATLTAWLDGTPVTPRFPTPLEKRLRTA